jgi:hypothetical protein
VDGAGHHRQAASGAQLGLGPTVEVEHHLIMPPAMSSVGAVTAASCGRARSGRPPRDTTAATPEPGSAAAQSAAAAPVLAPK